MLSTRDVNPLNAPLTLTPALIQRHDRPGPRYTSYPTADRFVAEITQDEAVAAYQRANAERPGEPLSVYIHLPFCESLCTYCGCNVTITRNQAKLDAYLGRLRQEFARVAAHLPHRTSIQQLHLGGGTPNAYSITQLASILEDLGQHFSFTDDAEIAIELDPRRSQPKDMRSLKRLGFNRISMGVQDLDAVVQSAISRVCSFSHIKNMVDAAREAGFDSINLDLIYGLPHQSRGAFGRTLQKVAALRPDRFAIYSFAYVPWLRPQQLKILPEWLPDTETKLALFCDARELLVSRGYEAIGMDHFALPTDGLSVAMKEGRLRRNFQGYTTLDVQDVLGFGVSAIGDIGGAYLQNQKSLKLYNLAIDAGALALSRGRRLTEDDALRRYVIHQLMCNFEVQADAVQARFGIDFAEAFAPELEELQTNDHLRELAVVDASGVKATTIGQLFVRVVGAVFDTYLGTDAGTRGPRYSRTV